MLFNVLIPKTVHPLVQALSFLFMLLTFPAICAAQEPERQPSERPANIKAAQDIIDACWAISEDNRSSGSTPRMRTGALDSALCMEDAIVLLVSNYLNKNDPDILKQYRDDMDKLRAGYGHMMWNLYNYHDGCRAGCGTLFHVFHNDFYASLLEDILKKAAKQIYDYDLQDDLFGAGVLIGKNPDAVKFLPEKPSSICLGETCGTFSLREVHGIYAVEGFTESENNYVAIHGFVVQTNDKSLTFHGNITSIDSMNEKALCEKKGDFSFKLINNKTWMLDVHDISCLAGQKKITLRT